MVPVPPGQATSSSRTHQQKWQHTSTHIYLLKSGCPTVRLSDRFAYSALPTAGGRTAEARRAETLDRGPQGREHHWAWRAQHAGRGPQCWENQVKVKPARSEATWRLVTSKGWQKQTLRGALRSYGIDKLINVNKFGKTKLKSLKSALISIGLNSAEVLANAKSQLLKDIDSLNLSAKGSHIQRRSQKFATGDKRRDFQLRRGVYTHGSLSIVISQHSVKAYSAAVGN